MSIVQNVNSILWPHKGVFRLLWLQKRFRGHGWQLCHPRQFTIKFQLYLLRHRNNTVWNQEKMFGKDVVHNTSPAEKSTKLWDLQSPSTNIMHNTNGPIIEFLISNVPQICNHRIRWKDWHFFTNRLVDSERVFVVKTEFLILRNPPNMQFQAQRLKLTFWAKSTCKPSVRNPNAFSCLKSNCWCLSTPI